MRDQFLFWLRVPFPPGATPRSLSFSGQTQGGYYLPWPPYEDWRILGPWRLPCCFAGFSYKANTFIFYAKVIQRIYIKVGRGSRAGSITDGQETAWFPSGLRAL